MSATYNISPVVAEQRDAYPIALLIKQQDAFNESGIRTYYFESLKEQGVDLYDIAVYGVYYSTSNPKKVSVKDVKGWLTQFLDDAKQMGIETIYCCDANYFKQLTKLKKAEAHLGYVLPCAIEGFEHLNVIYGVNYRSIVYNPANHPKLDQSLTALVDHLNGQTNRFKHSIIENAEYIACDNVSRIASALDSLREYETLACDIETFSLRFIEAGIGTIAFATNATDGIAFQCDYDSGSDDTFGFVAPERNDNVVVRELLKNFFESYQGTLIFHNAAFDIKVLVYTLWMDHMLDTTGLIKGLSVMTRSYHDTKTMAYLCYNTTADLSLSLKDLAQSYAGNYAQEDIKDILMIEPEPLLEYNLIDACATYWLYNRDTKKLTSEQQEEIYHTLFMPSLTGIIRTELTGIPLNMKEVQKAEKELTAICFQAGSFILSHPAVKRAEKTLTHHAWEKDYLDRKNKAKNPDKIQPKDQKTFPKIYFNYNSTRHLTYLLEGELELPRIESTKTGQYATGAKTLEALRHHVDADDVYLIECLLDNAKASKILNTFIAAFQEQSYLAPDGKHYLFGSFNLGGTVSGRLSSSNPNLQNLPASGVMGKLIKRCVQPPQGWLWCGADFSSLEDRISALTTNDPEKLKVYEDGYDGHSLRAYAYFGDQMPDIDPDSVESINSIADKYPELRQTSKAPTFLLTYGGTHFGLQKNCGFSQNQAKLIESSYHEMYAVSDQWVAEQIKFAQKKGYVEAAFGLRVRTPLLPKVALKASDCPYEAHSEARTAGNALGQSWCLLNNRAANEFFERLDNSPYQEDVKVCAYIHDAIYLLVRDNITVLKWVNDNLIACMEWQEHPAIQHDTVKLGAELDVHWQSWAQPITLPNYADEDTLAEVCYDGVLAYQKKVEDAAA